MRDLHHTIESLNFAMAHMAYKIMHMVGVQSRFANGQFNIFDCIGQLDRFGS
jgi:hypothetical protein